MNGEIGLLLLLLLLSVHVRIHTKQTQTICKNVQTSITKR